MLPLEKKNTLACADPLFVLGHCSDCSFAGSGSQVCEILARGRHEQGVLTFRFRVTSIGVQACLKTRMHPRT